MVDTIPKYFIGSYCPNAMNMIIHHKRITMVDLGDWVDENGTVVENKDANSEYIRLHKPEAVGQVFQIERRPSDRGWQQKLHVFTGG